MKKNLRVAVIEDDEDDFLILCDLLQSDPVFHVQADWIQDSSTAAERILDADYQLLFIDYRMGDFSGIALTRDLRAMDCEIPIVMVTSVANPGMERAAMHAGVDYFVDKHLLSEPLLSTTLHFGIGRWEMSDSLTPLRHTLTKLPARRLFIELLDGFCRVAHPGMPVSLALLAVGLTSTGDAEPDRHAMHLAWRELVLRLDRQLEGNAVVGHVDTRTLGCIVLGDPAVSRTETQRTLLYTLATQKLDCDAYTWQPHCLSGWADWEPGMQGVDLFKAAEHALCEAQPNGPASTAEVIPLSTRGRDYGRRVLLVDDSKSSQQLGQQLLSGLGVDADVASTGQVALKLVMQRQYDLIFMDIEMPGMDGFEVANLLRQRQLAVTPIVALIDREDDEIRALCRVVHMSACLVKPLHAEALIGVLDRLFDF